MSRTRPAKKSVVGHSAKAASAQPDTATSLPPGRKPSDKKLKSYRLSEQKIAAAQKVLREPSATATIEAALDLVVFRQELIQGTDALFGIEITPYGVRGR